MLRLLNCDSSRREAGGLGFLASQLEGTGIRAYCFLRSFSCYVFFRRIFRDRGSQAGASGYRAELARRTEKSLALAREDGLISAVVVRVVPVGVAGVFDLHKLVDT